MENKVNEITMSKRCELQKEYYANYGSYKGNGKYNNYYVKWLEDIVLSSSQQKPEISINISELVDEFMDGFEDPFTRGEMFKSETSAHSISIAYYFELAMEYALLHKQDIDRRSINA